MALANKNIGIAKEPTYASETAPTYYPRVTNMGAMADLNTRMVDDTAGTRKGYANAVNLNEDASGDVGGYVYSDDIGTWLLGAMGEVESSSVTAGYVHTFSQIASGELPSFTVAVDREVEVVRLLGARIGSLEFTAENDIVEFTVNLSASSEETGASAFSPSSDEDLLPFTFSQATIKFGDTLAAASGAAATPMDAWSFNYDNDLEKRWQSGSAGATRDDAKIAGLTGSFTKFYEDTNFNTWRESSTVKSCIIELEGADFDSGPHKHKLILEIPRIRIMSSERPYEAGNLVVESSEWSALYDSSEGYLFKATVYNEKASYAS